jgi:glycosyltransferase involved in cell wall biosynthesis
MKILFHTNAINHGGTTIAITDYAKYNQEILGNESVLVFNHTENGYVKDMSSEPKMINLLSKQFEIRSYGSVQDFDKCTHGIDVCYHIRFGTKEWLSDNTKNAVHAVFQAKEPHGDSYAYVSEWLSNTMSGGAIPYVPHIIHLPQANDNYRSKMAIPKDATIIAKFGGYNSFDMPFALNAVIKALTARSDLYFVFVNSPVFYNHPRIRYLPEITDFQEKSNFIASCDGMLHARSLGETFGLAICEFLFHNKPVMAHNSGIMGRHHIDLLKNTGLLYNNEDQLLVMLLSFNKNHNNDYRQIVEKFNPKSVMDKFKNVFLG